MSVTLKTLYAPKDRIEYLPRSWAKRKVLLVLSRHFSYLQSYSVLHSDYLNAKLWTVDNSSLLYCQNHRLEQKKSLHPLFLNHRGISSPTAKLHLPVGINHFVQQRRWLKAKLRKGSQKTGEHLEFDVSFVRLMWCHAERKLDLPFSWRGTL